MVRIITDSSTLHTVEEANALGVETLPLCVNIDNLEGRDLQMDMKDFYERIRKGQIPRSSQPPIGEVVDMLDKYKDSDIINITIADGLSGTYQSACAAKKMSENRERIMVFNCGPHCVAIQYIEK